MFGKLERGRYEAHSELRKAANEHASSVALPSALGAPQATSSPQEEIHMKRITLVLTIALIAALALVVAACGDDETTTTAASPTPSETMAAKDIVATAVDAGNFTTLAAALEAAGLVETLQGAGPFTVFAPDDAAFATLPAGTVDALLKDPKGDLTAILTYHVVPGNYPSSDLTDGMKLTTVQGEEITITIKDGSVYANEAMVTSADITASNGTIHVIDGVLIPPSMQ
jgi:uncharacterized surface protein with fasciclin (FAS1) repeats